MYKTHTIMYAIRINYIKIYILNKLYENHNRKLTKNIAMIKVLDRYYFNFKIEKQAFSIFIDKTFYFTHFTHLPFIILNNTTTHVFLMSMIQNKFS